MVPINFQRKLIEAIRNLIIIFQNKKVANRNFSRLFLNLDHENKLQNSFIL